MAMAARAIYCELSPQRSPSPPPRRDPSSSSTSAAPPGRRSAESGMVRSRRHTTSTGPSASTPPPHIDAQEQQEAPVQHPTVETVEPEVFRGRKRSSRLWDVAVRGENGEVRQKKMRAIDMFTLSPGERVIVQWNHRDQPIDSSGGMLAQFLGRIASNCQIFSLAYEKWQKIPDSHKDHVWNNYIKTKVEVNDDGHKSYIMKSLGKKWRDHRYHLYNSMKCDPDGPREANIDKKPQEVPLDQWVAFVDYRARPETKETQLSRSVTRAEVFQASHTTSTGSFINEEARHNHENLVIRSQSSSENEAFCSVFGKEHPGYVRGMGLGVVPTQMYGSSRNLGGRSAGGVDFEARHNALQDVVDRLTHELKETREHVAFLMTRETQNVTPNQENVGSPVVKRPSSHGSYSAHAEENANRSA